MSVPDFNKVLPPGCQARRPRLTDARLPPQVFALYQALPGPEATELACLFGMLASRRRIGGLLGGLVRRDDTHAPAATRRTSPAAQPD